MQQSCSETLASFLLSNYSMGWPVLLLFTLTLSCAPDGGTRPARNAQAGTAQGSSTFGDTAVGGGAPDSIAAAQTEQAPAQTPGPSALQVPGFSPAVVFVPATPGPHPLIVAAHGAGGLPEWECDYWRRLSRERAFLLCLRGERISNAEPSGYFYRTHLALEREFRAAVVAFQQRFPDAPRSAALYAGFSQGATMGASMILEHANQFPYLALIEGGYQYWSQASARRFARAGGKRVLFVCGTQWCAEQAEIPSAWLRVAGVETRIEHATGSGHTPGGQVMSRTQQALPWLTAGDPAWN